MAGMLQILTYLLAFYLIIKGLEFWQMALTSDRRVRWPGFFLAFVVSGACIAGAVYFVRMQDDQARSVSQSVRQP